MAGTTISDLIVPEIVAEVAAAKIVEKTALVQSGVADGDYENVDIKKGGNFINVPFWNELTGDDEVMTEGNPANLDKITMGEDIGVICHRIKAWSYTELSRVISGKDPSVAIGEQLGNFWAKRYDKALISVLKGALPGSHVLDVSQDTFGGADVKASLEYLINTMGLLGDNQDEFSVIIMHSKVFNDLRIAGLVDYGQTSFGENIIQNGSIPVVLGRRVIVSDNVPVETYSLTDGTDTENRTRYTTYIAQRGAMYLGFQRDLLVETDKDILAQENVLATNVHFCPHLRGVKWAVTTTNPDNATLATSTNWAQVWPDKAIRVVALKSN